MLEFDQAIGQGEEGVVSPDTHVVARAYSGASLPDDDGASSHQLSIVPLDTQALALAVPSVADASSGFLMSHLVSPFGIRTRLRALEPVPHL